MAPTSDSDLVEVSPFNLDPSFANDLAFPDEIRIVDTTLRDGEQTPGVVFSPHDKLQLARRLDEVGVDRIEAGNPVVSAKDREAIRQIATEGLDAEVYALARAIKADIDLALDCEADGVYVYSPGSDLEIERKFRWERDDAIGVPLAATEYAKDHGLDVSFWPFDTARADLDFVDELVSTLDAEGTIDAVIAVDTVGTANPHAMAHLVREMKAMTDLPVESHCHNDFGLGTANALFSAAAGAEIMHTTVNGLGERTGNPALDEVVAGLRYLYGRDVDVDMTAMRALSEEVERRSDLPVAPDKPFVGDNAYRFSSGLVIDGLRRDPFTFVPVLPEAVGQEFTYLLGKNSGRGSLELKLEEAGVDPEALSDDDYDELLAAVKSISESQERPLDDHEFYGLVEARHPSLLE